jgi:hypothetical protein
MNEPSNRSAKNGFQRRWSLVAQIGAHIVNGPRSIMFETDPEGLQEWMEAVIRLTRITLAPPEIAHRSVWRLPRCMGEDQDGITLLRSCIWEKQIDIERCKTGWIGMPSVRINYQSLTTKEVVIVDDLVRQIDQAIKEFPFAVEGFGQTVEALQPSAEGNVEPAERWQSRTLVRATRFQGLKLNWQYEKLKPTELDSVWNELWDAIPTLSTTGSRPEGSGFVEKFEIEPSKYLQILSLSSSQADPS